MMGPLPLGRVVATPGALTVLLEAGEDPLSYLARHSSGNWGDLDGHDRRENERSLIEGCNDVAPDSLAQSKASLTVCPIFLRRSLIKHPHTPSMTGGATSPQGAVSTVGVSLAPIL